MTHDLTSELLAVCLLVLLLVLLVVLVLWWILRRSRNLTELKISAGQPTRTLTIRTEPDHADQLLERLLDRVFVQVETESGNELGAEPEREVGGRRGSHSGSDPEVSTAASLPSIAVNTFPDRLWNWITIRSPPSATPPPSPPPSPSPSPTPPPPHANPDQTEDVDPQQSARASLSTQDSSCSFYSGEE